MFDACPATVSVVAGTQAPPGEFIPLAEQSGLSLDIFALGVRRSAEWLNRLSRVGRSGYVSVNLAAGDLDRTDLLPLVMNLLGRTQLPPASLQIEITEQSLVRDFADSERNLRALKNLGCRSSTGSSSSESPTIRPRRRSRASHLRCRVVSRLEIVADGVETVEQQTALEGIGFRYAQGYLFGRPMTPDQLTTWISQKAAS